MLYNCNIELKKEVHVVGCKSPLLYSPTYRLLGGRAGTRGGQEGHLPWALWRHVVRGERVCSRKRNFGGSAGNGDLRGFVLGIGDGRRGFVLEEVIW